MANIRSTRNKRSNRNGPSTRTGPSTNHTPNSSNNDDASDAANHQPGRFPGVLRGPEECLEEFENFMASLPLPPFLSVPPPLPRSYLPGESPFPPLFGSVANETKLSEIECVASAEKRARDACDDRRANCLKKRREELEDSVFFSLS
jgi:hypothetical protein